MRVSASSNLEGGRSAAGGFMPLKRSAASGFTLERRSAAGGFTLVEVMIALLIFGLLAAAGVALLSFSVRAQAATSAKLDDISALNRMTAIVGADLAQARNRATRERDGTPVPPFQGNPTSDGSLLAFVRGGWTNLDDEPRSDAQKVRYRLAGNGVLERVVYPMLDGGDPLPAAALLDGVSEARLRYRVAGAWSDGWDERADQPLPDAVEFAITRRDGRRYRAVFLVGTGYAPPPPEAGNGG